MTTSWNPEKKHSERERWICIYPAYINSRKTVAEGRRIVKDKCVENPTCHEIRDVLDAAGFKIGLENKLYPREANKDSLNFRGRIRVQFKTDDGMAINPQFETRNSLLLHICEMIPKLKTRTQKQGSAEQNLSSQNAAKKGKGKKSKK